MQTVNPYFRLACIFFVVAQIVIGAPLVRAQAPDLKFDRVISTGSMFYPGPVLQDRDGFVWLGSQGSGLLKFDGYAIQRYNAGPDSILDDNVNALYEDRDGFLWVYTMGGLSRYDKTTDTFTSYQHDPAQPTSISSSGGNQVLQTIAEDPSGAIWIGTSGGLNRFDKATNTFTRYLHDPNNPNSLSSNDIFSVYADASGIVWVGADVGLNRLDPASGAITRYAHDPNDPASLSAGTVLALHEDKDGILWVGTTQGLNRWDKAAETFTHYYADPSNPAGIPNDYVRIIAEDAEGNLWLSWGAEGGPLTRFNKAQGTVTNYRHDPRDSSTLSSDTVMGLHVSATGIIWLTHTGGMVDKYDPNSHKFNIYLNNPDDPHTISDQLINTSYEDSAGAIWFAVNNGLNKYDRATGQFTRYLSNPDDPKSIPGVFVCGPLEDSQGNFWVLSSDNYLSLFDREKGEVIENYETIHNPITVIEDKTNPRLLWIVSWGEGLAKFDKVTHQTTIFDHDPNDPGSIGANTIAQMYQDDEGFIWIPAGGGGVSKFDPRTEKVVQHYRHDPDDPTSLGSDTAVHVFEDSTGVFWIGAYGGGLNKLNPDGTFERYTEENGFPTNNITNILEDNDGNLWLGSKIGYIRFDPRTKAAKVYTIEDGLAGNEFQEASLFKARDGTLWLATITGANSFDPREMRDNPLKPPVYFTALKQGGDAMELGAAPEKVKEITLDWQHNFFEFEYAALNYTKPEKNQYQYMLEGYDQDWYNAGTRRFGRYSGLSGGTYTLRVRGSNNDGVWSDQEAVLKVTVVPPWWDTWAFRIGLGAVLVGLVVGGVTWRIHTTEEQRRTLARLVEQRTADLQQANTQLQVAKEEAEAQRAAADKARLEAETQRTNAEAARQEAELQREKAEVASQAKSEFLSSMSHELRTPLNGILGYAQILKRDKTLTTLQQDGLNVIQQSGDHLLTLINDILDLSKIEAGKLELNPHEFNFMDFLNGVAGIIRVRAQSKGLGFALHDVPPLPQAVYADDKRLRQVLINLLNNAVKFTDAGSITLRVEGLAQEATGQGTAQRVRFAVEDTGVGIAAEDMEKIFRPFEQTAAGKQQGEGTGLGLSITRRLVELMGGELQVQSTPGQGSRFWFQVLLPEVALIAVTEPAAPAREIVGYAGPRQKVLVVDDKAHNRAVFLHSLAPLGFEVMECDNGADAIRLAQEMHPDLIIMDMIMPGMTGFEAVQRIRTLPDLAQTHIFGASASVFAEDQYKVKLAGCDAFVEKPVALPKLLALITQHLSITWVYAETAEEAGAAAPAIPEVTPPQADLRNLHEIAQLGNMSKVRAWAEDLAARDAQYTAFAARVQELARGFRKKEIVALVEQHLPAPKQGTA